jgi:ribosome recycling factor
MKLDTKKYAEKMSKSVDAYADDLATLRVGKANPEVLTKIEFEYYGAPTPLLTMANVSVSDARTLVITPYDKSTLKAMDKAIQISDLGIHPQNDGSVIRLTFPPLTEERRRDMTKQVAQKGENAKVAVRNIRRDANDAVKAAKKNSEMTEDEAKQSDKEIQDLTDKYIKQIEAITEAKNKEIMTI